MAEDRPTPPAERVAPDKENEFEIERDSRFISIAADTVYTLDRGEDVTLSLIEQGPRPIKVRPPRDTGDVDQNGMARGGLAWGGSFTEIARVRLSPQTALLLAMQLLDHGFSADRINVEVFQATISEMIARHSTAGTTAEDASEPSDNL